MRPHYIPMVWHESSLLPVADAWPSGPGQYAVQHVQRMASDSMPNVTRKHRRLLSRSHESV